MYCWLTGQLPQISRQKQRKASNRQSTSFCSSRVQVKSRRVSLRFTLLYSRGRLVKVKVHKMAGIGDNEGGPERRRGWGRGRRPRQVDNDLPSFPVGYVREEQPPGGGARGYGNEVKVMVTKEMGREVKAEPQPKPVNVKAGEKLYEKCSFRVRDCEKKEKVPETGRLEEKLMKNLSITGTTASTTSVSDSDTKMNRVSEKVARGQIQQYQQLPLPPSMLGPDTSKWSAIPEVPFQNEMMMKEASLSKQVKDGTDKGHSILPDRAAKVSQSVETAGPSSKGKPQPPLGIGPVHAPSNVPIEGRLYAQKWEKDVQPATAKKAGIENANGKFPQPKSEKPQGWQTAKKLSKGTLSGTCFWCHREFKRHEKSAFQDHINHLGMYCTKYKEQKEKTKETWKKGGAIQKEPEHMKGIVCDEFEPEKTEVAQWSEIFQTYPGYSELGKPDRREIEEVDRRRKEYLKEENVKLRESGKKVELRHIYSWFPGHKPVVKEPSKNDEESKKVDMPE